MKTLFDQIELNELKLKNRFVRSATWEGLSNSNGYCTNEIANIMEELAKGQVALLITGGAYVDPAGQSDFQQLGIYDDCLISSYCNMVKIVHRQNSKIILQIVHAGCRSARHLTHLPFFGPSSIKIEKYGYCEEMSEEQIKKSVKDFTRAAIRASRIGFDGIQIHAAHGYLLSQFLSPYFNKRKDKYGGNILNRARFLLEIIHSIRTELGSKFCVTVKLNSEDFIENGFSLEDMVQTCLLLEKERIDAVEISGGIEIKGSKHTPYRTTSCHSDGQEVYYEKAAELFKRNMVIPLILVGGIRSFKTASSLVTEEKADFISLCRPFIREPDLVKRWQDGDKRRATCISCNRCLEPAKMGDGIYCVVEKEKNKTKTF